MIRRLVYRSSRVLTERPQIFDVPRSSYRQWLQDREHDSPVYEANQPTPKRQWLSAGWCHPGIRLKRKRHWSGTCQVPDGSPPAILAHDTRIRVTPCKAPPKEQPEMTMSFQQIQSADDLLDLAILWAPFGDPPAEDVFVRFGIDFDEYHYRLLQIVRDHQRRSAPSEPTRQDRFYAPQVLRLLEERLRVVAGSASSRHSHRSAPGPDDTAAN